MYLCASDENDAVAEEFKKRCLTGNLVLIKEYLDTGSIPEETITMGLMVVSQTGDLEVIKYLTTHAISVTAGDNTALRWCSANGHLTAVRYLINHGADLHAVDDWALRYAVMSGHLKVVKCLVEHGADIDARNGDALKRSIDLKHTAITAYLIAAMGQSTNKCEHHVRYTMDITAL